MKPMTRRGSVLMAVLLVITIGALVAASLATLSSAHVSAATGAMSRARLRAAAWSGVQGAMAELASTREGLLNGEAPELTREWTIADPVSGREIVVRLIPWDGTDGERLAQSEAAKIDLNAAPAAMIAKLPGVGEDLASAIVAARPFGAVEDVLAVEGITPELWRERGDDGAEGLGMSRLVTVHAFDPNIQHGVDGADEHAGKLRINLNAGWSDRLGRDLDERFGDGTGNGVKALMDDGKTFERPTDVVRVARSLGAGAPDLVGVLDALACVPDQYVPGLVDIMHAPAEVLASVPGIDEALASAIVSARLSGSSDERWSPLWPVLEGLAELDAYTPALDHVATRSLQWRVRVEAGYMDEDPWADAPALSPRFEVEAVIDVASERPRIAWMRETTMDELSWRMNPLANPPEVETPLEPPTTLENPNEEGMFEDGGLANADAAVEPETVIEPDEADTPGPSADEDEPTTPRDNRRGRWTPEGGA